MFDDSRPLNGVFEPLKQTKCERTAKVPVWIVRREGEAQRRFLSLAEAERYAYLKGRLSKVVQTRGSARDLFRWGLGPAPEHYRKPVPKPPRRRRVVACPQCPHCLAKRKGEPVVPFDPAEYDGPDPSTLMPRAAAPVAPFDPADYAPDPRDAEWDLSGLSDPRLTEPLPDDY